MSKDTEITSCGDLTDTEDVIVFGDGRPPERNGPSWPEENICGTPEAGDHHDAQRNVGSVIHSEPREAQQMKRRASCSDVQQLAEQLMVSEFSGQLGRELGKATIPIGKAKVAVDGFHKDDHRVTLVEAWAHVGKAKSAQRNKVLGDMLKLALLTNALRRSYPSLKVESYLVFADRTAATVVNGKGWASHAAKEFGIEPRVISLSSEVINTIKEAQVKQDIRTGDECDTETT